MLSQAATFRLSSRFCNAATQRTLRRPQVFSKSTVSWRHASTTSAPRPAKSSIPAGSYRSPSVREAELNKKFAEQGTTRRIYTSPRNFGYFVGVYTISAASIGYSMVLAHDYVFANLPGIQKWVQYTFAIPTIFLVGLGTWVYLRGMNHIRFIDAVPTAAGLSLHVRLRPAVPLPFLRGKLIKVKPGEIILDHKVVPPAYDTRKKKPEGDIIEKITTHLSQIGFDFFIGARKIFTSEGFVKTTLADRKATYKIDITGTFDEDRRLVNTLLKFDS